MAFCLHGYLWHHRVRHTPRSCRQWSALYDAMCCMALLDFCGIVAWTQNLAWLCRESRTPVPRAARCHNRPSIKLTPHHLFFTVSRRYVAIGCAYNIVRLGARFGESPSQPFCSYALPANGRAACCSMRLVRALVHMHALTTTACTGPEAFPNSEFWRELPDLCRDGARFAYDADAYSM